MAKALRKYSKIKSTSSPKEKELYPLLATPLAWALVCLVSGIGKGGIGSVYLAEECHSTRKIIKAKAAMPKVFAVKVIDARGRKDGCLRYLKREYRLHAKVASRPNIVQIYSLHATPENVLMFFKYAQDGDLLGFLNTHGELVSRHNELLKIIYLQVLDAVVYIHRQGIYHCDIKPDNLICKREGGVIRILLTDFGCSSDKLIIYGHDGYYEGTSFYLRCVPQAMLESASSLLLPPASTFDH